MFPFLELYPYYVTGTDIFFIEQYVVGMYLADTILIITSFVNDYDKTHVFFSLVLCQLFKHRIFV